MGYFKMSARAAVLTIGLFALAACEPRDPQPEPATETAVQAETEGVTTPEQVSPPVTIICPGDSRCDKLENFIPGQRGGTVQSCEVTSERVILNCRSGRRCPGPGCANGQNPGSAAERCSIEQRYMFITCPPARPPAPDGEGDPDPAATAEEPAPAG